jgi:hypothetical protein
VTLGFEPLDAARPLFEKARFGFHFYGGTLWHSPCVRGNEKVKRASFESGVESWLASVTVYL